ncbi:hypothetical protein [Alloscardovia macacae]|nr:hypothetical protein [Alloscardovia macacae]OTA26629.1 hypothetical protein B9G54_04395 [Alloscardovia macacae]OTA28984.1 hypothetical protein B9T39_04805 [Alloscardovia macacae]
MPATSASVSYPVRRVMWTRKQLVDKQSALTKKYGSFEDLYARSNAYGLSLDESEAMSELQHIKFLMKDFD